MTDIRHVVVTPAHDEAAHLPGLVASMAAQSLRPSRWIIVDDGSSDDTVAILRAAAAEHDWITPLSFPDPGARAVGSRVARVVLWGLSQRGEAWDYVSKIDADLTLPRDYFARVLAAFAAEPALGICGGACVVAERGRRRREQVAADHTRGALKTYSRACWEAIGGIQPVHGWDGIDGLRAQMHGFATRHLPDLEVLHHRPTGSFEGALRGRFTAGRFAHYMGYHPLFMVARSLRRMAEPPRLTGGAAMLAGYAYDWARRAPVMDDAEAVRFLRRKQLGRLGLGPLLGAWPRRR